MLAALLAALVLFTQPIPAIDVALDPGHSRADIGSVGGGLREYQLTLDLARRVRTRLESAHLSVRLTREDDQPLSAYTNPLATEQIQAEQQARIAAAGPSRIYVSLHFNGGPTRLRGTETYFNPERAPEAATADYSLAALLQEHVLPGQANGRGTYRERPVGQVHPARVLPKVGIGVRSADVLALARHAANDRAGACRYINPAARSIGRSYRRAPAASVASRSPSFS